jgi:hypothetical protein
VIVSRLIRTRLEAGGRGGPADLRQEIAPNVELVVAVVERVVDMGARYGNLDVAAMAGLGELGVRGVMSCIEEEKERMARMRG